MDWQDAIEIVKPYIVKVSTPQGTGTGFFLANNKDGSIVGVATAAHVVDYAENWEQPIRISHYESGASVLLRSSEEQRSISIDVERDTAVVLFYRGNLPFPETPLDLIEESIYLPQGRQLGWLGFPSVSPETLCFFTGSVSAYLNQQNQQSAYFVDGVVINGVSGGPTFFLDGDDHIGIVGVVSAYLPNRATGEAFPGLGLVTDVSHLQEYVLHLASLGDNSDEDEAPQVEVVEE